MEPKDLIGKIVVYQTLRGNRSGKVMRECGPDCVKVREYKFHDIATVYVQDIVRVLGG